MSTENKTESKGLVPNPRIIHPHRVAKTLKAGSFGADLADILMTNEGVKLGDGYDPTTGLRLSTNDFDLTNFYYMSGNTPVNGIAGVLNKTTLNCSKGVYGSEIGSVSSYSSANSYKADLKGAVGIGLGKVAVALSAAYEDSFASDGMHSDKVFGGKQVCNLNTIVAPEVNPQSNIYQNAAKAIRQASGEIDRDIKNIENAPDKFTRKTLIAEFYTNHGTYMVSSVRLGAVAIKNVHMAENKSSGGSSLRVAAAASYSSPFSDVSASAEMNKASKFSAADWTYSIAAAQYPTGAISDGIVASIKELEAEITAMKNTGVIDFSKLAADPAVIKETERPVLPVFDNTKIAADSKAATSAFTAFKTAKANVNNEIPGAKSLKSARYSKNVTNITAAMEQISKLNDPGDTGKALSSFLASADQKTFNESAPQITKWEKEGLVDLYTAAVEELAKGEASDPTEITAIENEIKHILGQVKEEIAEEKVQEKEIEAEKAAEDKAAADKAKDGGVGITWSQFLLSKMKKSSPSDYDRYSIYIKDQPEQAGKILAVWQMEQSQATMKEWRSEFETAGGLFTVPLMVPAEEAQQFKALALKAADTSNIYDGYGVLDYSVTPWAKIFPALSQNFSIDDAKEVGKGLILNNLAMNYLEIYSYLDYVVQVDSSLNPLHTSVAGEKRRLDALRLAIIDTVANDDNADTITFNGVTYNLNDSGYIDLNNAVTTYIQNSALYKSDWYKISKTLFDKGLIGTHGAFAGLQPVAPVSEASNTYSVIPDRGTVLDKNRGWGDINQEPLMNIPSRSTMVDSYWSNSPLLVILSRISGRYYGSQELPSGVLMGDRGMYLPSSSEMKTNYMTSAYNLATTLVLKYLPSNSKASQILSVMPVVMNNTKMSGNNIFKLGLIDSHGRIWGDKAGSGGTTGSAAFNQETATYSLDLATKVGTEAANYAYKLTLDDGGDGLVTEFRWSADGGGTWSDLAYKFFIGKSIEPDLFKMSSYSNNQVLSAADNSNLMVTRLATLSSAVWIFQTSTYIKNGFIPEGIKKSKIGIDYMINALPDGSSGTIKHQLVIKPIMDEDVSNMNRQLKNDVKKQPLLPTYPF